jgi:hypothetical protein
MVFTPQDLKKGIIQVVNENLPRGERLFDLNWCKQEKRLNIHFCRAQALGEWCWEVYKEKFKGQTKELVQLTRVHAMPLLARDRGKLVVSTGEIS